MIDRTFIGASLAVLAVAAASPCPAQSAGGSQAGASPAIGMQLPNSAVHLGGYGHVGFASGEKAPIDQETFNEVGFNPIFHYQYKDMLLFETELEIQVDEEGEAEFGLEYANMNYFVNDNVTIFGGKFLSPVGYFIQNLHPAWINKFPSKPAGFQEEGGAAPVSDVGMGIRGAFPIGATKANYALYVGNGPRLELNEAGDEIESILTTGATTNPSNKKLIGGRFGILPAPHLEIGVSAATSKVAVVDDANAIEPDRSYSVLGVDFAYKVNALDVRGEYIESEVGDLASSVAPEGGTWKAWYLQGAYRIRNSRWEPAIRFGEYTSPHEDQSHEQQAVSINYWFTSNIVGKFAYEFNSGMVDTPNDANRLIMQFGYGF